MGTIADFISENQIAFDRFAELGVLPLSMIRKVKIFNHYKSLTGKSKMQKYEQTSIEMGVDLCSVRNAVRYMNYKI